MVTLFHPAMAQVIDKSQFINAAHIMINQCKNPTRQKLRVGFCVLFAYFFELFVSAQEVSDFEQAGEFFPEYIFGLFIRLPQVGNHYHAASGVMRSPQTVA